MKRLLRKSPAGIYVSYFGGDFTHDLTGSEFELEDSDGRIRVSIDLTRNLRVRNKAENCYADACELAREHSSLRSVQITDDQTIAGLAAANQRTPNARWELKLLLGEKGTFNYSVSATPSNGSVFLNIG